MGDNFQSNLFTKMKFMMSDKKQDEENENNNQTKDKDTNLNKNH